MNDPYSVQKFARRVAFGLRLDQDVGDDPVAWAVAQLQSVPPIDIYEARGGVRRKDLPDDMRLRWGDDEAMAALKSHWDAEREVSRAGKSMPAETFRKFRIERVVVFKVYEHWKEVQARATTAVYGAAPAFERFWHFWTNHFTVAPASMRNDTLVGPFQRMLRGAMTGSFRDMLWKVVTHPAMLLYLDNDENTGPNSPARQQGKTTNSINENLGRELLELFTVSPAAGYTQEDVAQTTLILTGWRVETPTGRHQFWNPLGTFFDQDFHEPGTRSVMGKRYEDKSKGSSKLESLVSDLAAHPAAARYLATKLCTYFIADDPPREAVEYVEKAYRDNGGDLQSLHRAVIEMCWSTIDSTRKFLNPETWLWQSLTLTESQVPPAVPWDKAGGFTTIKLLENLGQAIPFCPQPNGWPIKSDGWLSKEMLDRRVRFARAIAIRGGKNDPDQAARTRRLVDVHLAPDSPSRGLLQTVLSKQPVQATVLLLLCPELLWS